MTQEELKLVLDALKWCHGGEPCGTAEAIAVVEKALAQEQEQEPVAKNEEGRITWLIDSWPQNCLLYTNAPQLKESEQKPYGYLWYTHYMEKRFTHYKPNEDQLSQCIGEVTPVYIRARGEQA